MANILHISLRTIQRYSNDDVMDPHTSEHIMLIDRLYRKGYGYFATPNGFQEWMQKPKTFFGGLTPISMIDTYSGIEVITKKLTQMEHGVFV